MIVKKNILQKLQVISEIKITYSNKVKKQDRIKIKSSTDAVEFIRNLFDGNIEYKEQFYTLYLNRSNEILGYTLISVGGISGTVVDPRIIFQAALKSNSSTIIVTHNHPSGNEKPSENDINITKKLKEAGDILNIKLLDHIIVTVDEHYSFTDNGKI